MSRWMTDGWMDGRVDRWINRINGRLCSLTGSHPGKTRPFDFCDIYFIFALNNFELVLLL